MRIGWNVVGYSFPVCPVTYHLPLAFRLTVAFLTIALDNNVQFPTIASLLFNDRYIRLGIE